MKWAHFLHIYQPSDQHPGVLEKIVNESYRPLIRGFLKEPKTKITLNINAVLSEMLFEHGYRDVIENIKLLIEMGRVELTGSAKFHAFLPFLTENEVKRQIMLNHETNKRYFGDAFNPKGFFPPEMAYSPKVAEVAANLGYEWIILDEVSMSSKPGGLVNDSIRKIGNLDIDVYFREKAPSNLIMGALVRSAKSLEASMKDRMSKNEYVITAMDGETFGHHRPGLEKILFDVMKSDRFDNVLISDLKTFYPKGESVMPLDSTWASSVKDVNAGNPFNLWFDKSNKIHEYEWELATLAITALHDSVYSDERYPKMLEENISWDEMTSDQKQGEEKKRQWLKARDALDRALNSDPWWWASAKPWWSVEMIEKGMFALFSVINTIPDVSDEIKDKGENLYKNILFTSHEWQRNGIVDEMERNDSKERRIPLSKRFGASDYYKALLEALKIQEKKASDNREYEQAIKWRDGQYKLERDLDIYDAVHILDLFRNEGDFEKFNEILSEYKNKFREISKGQPE